MSEDRHLRFQCPAKAICPDRRHIANALQIRQLPERHHGALVKMVSKAARLWAAGLTGISGKRCIVASLTAGKMSCEP